jgi:hypothetical protein
LEEIDLGCHTFDEVPLLSFPKLALREIQQCYLKRRPPKSLP